ncbi:hypothetical protein SteCoe_28325 [Stentor coeruleus]|uniref:Uncharacterized protein n=1 Tax=Stentor coeruleus TaxID=5963 RepID=A0A1R2B8F8_9CILI|nr:hypothetical protein SteCoe_28325 [Stentor coeruleus]
MSSRIIKQGAIAQILGSSLLIMRIIVILTLGSDIITILANLIMSTIAFITGIQGKITGKSRTLSSASRYTSWTMINLFSWTILGIISSIMQILYLISLPFDEKPGMSGVLIVWFFIFFTGSGFFRIFRAISILHVRNMNNQHRGQNDGLAEGYSYMPNQQGFYNQPQFGPLPQNDYVGQPVYLPPVNTENYRYVPEMHGNDIQYFPPGQIRNN